MNQCIIKYRPAVDSGSGSPESLTRRDDSMAIAASTTMSAASVCDRPAASLQVTPVAREPEYPIRVAQANGRTSAPAATARRSGARAPTRALMGQP